MLYRYILGGVALATTGYGLNRYFNGGGFSDTAHKNHNNNQLSKEICKNPTIRREAIRSIASFCYHCSEICYVLNELQEKLDSIVNLPELASAYISISRQKVLKFKRICEFRNTELLLWYLQADKTDL